MADAKQVSVPGRILLGVYLCALTAALSYFTAKLWPQVECPTATSSSAAGTSGAAPNPVSVADDKTTAKAPDRTKTTASDQKTSDNKSADNKSTDNKGKDTAGADAQPTTPPAVGPACPDARRQVQFFWSTIEFSMTAEVRLILLALVVGALGGCVHSTTSFIAFAGNGKLYSSWTWYYLLRTPISAALALIVYFVVRAGFLSPSSGTGSVNDFGIVAVSGLVGMFSKQATAKLDEVFNTLFRTEKQHEELADKLANKVPSLTAIHPATISQGAADTEITLTGDGFVDKSEVRWAGTKLDQSTFVSATQLKATVPAAKLTTPGSFEVTVFNPAPGGGASPPVKVTV